MIRTKLIAAAALLLWQDCALAQMQHRHGSDAACDEPALRCASKVTPAFASDGTLWLAWMAGGKVSVASSRDGGGSFSAQVEATPERLNLDWGPDARPKIAIDGKGHIALTFAIFKDKAFNGQVLYTHSEDGGKSFASPRPITADNESQRFETVGFDGNGALFATWLDKRNRLPAQQAGKKYEGAALFFASSVDGGASYSDARMAIDNTCECCRLALAFDPSNRPVVVFRNIFEGGVRDHAVITFADRATAGEAHRVAVDDWQVTPTPLHGPARIDCGLAGTVLRFLPPLAALAEQGLALVDRPYDLWAEQLGQGVDDVLAQLQRWLQQKTLSRFGVVVRHHELGYTANAMTVFDVPESEVDACGEALAQMPGVTLAYQRARAGDWPYNLYCMVHGRDRDSVRATVAQAVAHAGLAHRPHAMLFSLRRFKQTGARRFAAHTTHLAAHSCHTPAGAPHAHP